MEKVFVFCLDNAEAATEARHSVEGCFAKWCREDAKIAFGEQANGICQHQPLERREVKVTIWEDGFSLEGEACRVDYERIARAIERARSLEFAPDTDLVKVYASLSTKDPAAGSGGGIGMYLTLQLVRLHGGELRLEPGKLTATFSPRSDAKR